jgi:hypothetical protein
VQGKTLRKIQKKKKPMISAGLSSLTRPDATGRGRFARVDDPVARFGISWHDGW